MFIKDGKSLFNNIGVIIAIIILVILLFLSYNKCVAPIDLEMFEEPTELVPTEQPTPPPKDVRINISSGTVTINFTSDISNNAPIPTKFIVVLAQYDSSLKNTGNNKFYLSNEYELNTTVSADSTTYQTNLCTLINGIPSCGYSFSNLDITDTNGNLFYYKIGIAAVYSWGNSPFVIPYNISSANNLFTLDTSITQQDNLYNEFLQYKQANASLGQTGSANSKTGLGNTLATADGQYELIKAQLGNYPSNLIMNSTSATQGQLSDLVDKSMAQGLLNVNVSVSTPTIRI